MSAVFFTDATRACFLLHPCQGSLCQFVQQRKHSPSTFTFATVNAHTAVLRLLGLPVRNMTLSSTLYQSVAAPLCNPLANPGWNWAAIKHASYQYRQGSEECLLFQRLCHSAKQRLPIITFKP